MLCYTLLTTTVFTLGLKLLPANTGRTAVTPALLLQLRLPDVELGRMLTYIVETAGSIKVLPTPHGRCQSNRRRSKTKDRTRVTVPDELHVAFGVSQCSAKTLCFL